MKMNVSNVSGDNIDQLPADQSIPTHNELNIVNNLFKNQTSGMMRIFNELKGVIFLAILFFIFSLPQLDTLLRQFISYSDYILILIKAIIFVTIYYIVNNFYLLKK